MLHTHSDRTVVDALVELSHQLGDERRDWAVVAEGNVSASLDAEYMVVKASGSRLRTARPEDFLNVRYRDVTALLDDERASDADVREAFGRFATQAPERLPSVESLLHAVCIQDGLAKVVAHTHPTAVNAILCSNRANTLVRGSLFPDQIVVLGAQQLLMPYVDPGLLLARRVRADLMTFVEEYGEPPRVVYLANHGMFALASSVQEAIDITEMATKCARILIGALSIGDPTFLPVEQAERINTRPDELHRRAVLKSASARVKGEQTRGT